MIPTGEQSPANPERLAGTVISLGACGCLKAGEDGGMVCTVREFAVLNTGHEVTLTADRGWTTSAPWESISLTHAVRNIYNVVLPDDAEITAETHEWQLFQQRLRDAGVTVTVEALKALPYQVTLSVPS